mmetsp:Transcript_95776/g.255975  ORF Transcript_95776/g.255975 Transcript_95776/m.255975 type:complete len:296 (+) Transcript_95776:90-977(+)
MPRDVPLHASTTHPTLRLDTYLRNTDPLFQPVELARQPEGGFVRSMNTFGSNRPSPSFLREPRIKPFTGLAIDMSNQPPPANDMKGDTREGCYNYPPVTQPDLSYLALLENKKLMGPAERRAEAQLIKEKQAEYNKAKRELAEYAKRKRVLERKHKEGVVGIDGPLRDGTELYGEARDVMMSQSALRNSHTAKRHDLLSTVETVDDAVTMKNWGSDPKLQRSMDIPLLRKNVDPEKHPYRFYDTKSRIWPNAVSHWDPERAAVLRHHETRERSRNILNHSDNTLQHLPTMLIPHH